MSPEKFRKLAFSELEISTVNIISVMMWGNEQTVRLNSWTIPIAKGYPIIV